MSDHEDSAPIIDLERIHREGMEFRRDVERRARTMFVPTLGCRQCHGAGSVFAYDCFSAVAPCPSCADK